MSQRKEYTSSNARLPCFTDRFRKAVDKRGGITKASELLGISRPTVSYWYYGERTPDAESLITISNNFGLTTDYLLGLSDYYHKDKSVQTVQRVTALSEDAVFKLNEIAHGKDSDSFPAIISALIENSNAEFFLAILHSLLTLDEAQSESVEAVIDGKTLCLNPVDHLQAVLYSLFIALIPDLKKQFKERSADNG